MLRTADDALEASMNARAAQQLPESEDGARAVLQAVVDTLTALTNSAPPTGLQTKQAAVQWVNSSVMEWRQKAIERATTANCGPCMDPTTMATCMELITKLNATIGANPGESYAL